MDFQMMHLRKMSFHQCSRSLRHKNRLALLRCSQKNRQIQSCWRMHFQMMHLRKMSFHQCSRSLRHKNRLALLRCSQKNRQIQSC
ncbi:hypothetical protein QR680_003248 [Steinernema hermaphroditum]|uniref:Uncharacterized protein n=1 Tax=Steinernema hermaphroditum TaxID=289476 RepID=A0AA39LJU4_9BILA|nr:hypothetical protein QR680_003248 [Steinernema hermaphroditum]